MRSLLFTILAVLSAGSAWAVPVLEGLPTATQAHVKPQIPASKALILPVTAYTTDGEQVTLTATSSNPKIMVRVRTGNPLLKMTINHVGGAGDTPYSGDLVFQLFRDLTPRTAGFIGGFAQAGFYNNLIFHRLHNFADEYPEGVEVPDSFIYQGGDPAGNGSGGPGFTYENEFVPQLMFAGRGQLAMANSGYNSSTRKATNGSQFFITDNQPRFLDFNHTIFAQLTHGWELLDRLRETPRYAFDTDVSGETPDLPKSPVTITNATVVPVYVTPAVPAVPPSAENPAGTPAIPEKTYTTGVLVLSAIAAGDATITVTARDKSGKTISQAFTATAAMDTQNNAPFLSRVPNYTVPKGRQLNLPFTAVDLERDFITVDDELLDNGSSSSPKGYSAVLGRNVLAVLGNPSYSTSSNVPATNFTGKLSPVLSVTQYDMDYRGTIDGAARGVDDYMAFSVAVGDSALTPERHSFLAEPGLALTNVVAAKFRDADPRAETASTSAVINWGDGTANTTGVVTRDTSKPGLVNFQVTGTHTFAKAGIYRVTTTLTSNGGASQEAFSTAVVSANTVRALPEVLEINSPRVVNRLLATFTDRELPGPAKDYTATIDWGDGLLSNGVVRASAAGTYGVYGSHVYQDAEVFPVSVRIHKAGLEEAADAIAWSTIALNFSSPQHLPPFNSAHIVGEWTGVPADSNTASANKPTKVTTGDVATQSQTHFVYSLSMTNSGNLKSKPGTLRIYLSPDTELNTVPKVVNGVTIPADKLLPWGPRKSTSVVIPALQPGGSITYSFNNSNLGDYRLVAPANETGTGQNLLADFQYNDPVTDYQPVARQAVAGPLLGIFTSVSVLQVAETGSTATFTVRLDKAPTANVEIPLTVSDVSEAAISTPKLTFNPSNWATPQTVTVTGKSDTVNTDGTQNTSAVDGDQTFTIALGAAVSTDPIYSGMDADDVRVTNKDRDGNVVLSSTSLTTSESGTTTQFTIRMKQTPTAPVTVRFYLADATEGTVTLPDGTAPVGAGTEAEPLTVTFTPENGLSAKTVKVTGLPDSTVDGTITYSLKFLGNLSDDVNFKDVIPKSITISNTDVNTAP